MASEPAGRNQFEEGTEVRFPVVGVFEVWAQVQVKLRESTQIGDAGHVRSFSRGELERQGFLNSRSVSDGIDRDFDVGIVGLEAVEQIAQHLTFVAVVVPSDTQVDRLGEPCGE